MKIDSNVTGSAGKALPLGLLAVLGFSGTVPATRWCVRELDPSFVSIARAVGAALLAGLSLIWQRAPLPRRQQLWALAQVALGTVIGFPLLMAWALTHVPAAEAAMLLAFIPTFTALFGTLQAGERPAPSFWSANALGVGAVLWFSNSGPRSLQLGHVVLLLACMVCALGYTAGGRLARQMPGLRVVSWALVLSLPLLAPLLTFWVPFPHVEQVQATTWLGLGYVTLISMFLSFAPWYAALARGGIALTSQLQLLQPLFSVCWAAWLLGEATSARLWITLALVIGSIVWSRKAPWSVRQRGSAVALTGNKLR